MMDQNVTYPEMGTLTHVVAVSSPAGRCSGSLISADTVLTVAHCLVVCCTALNTNRQVGNTEVRVVAGIIDILKDTPNKQERYSKKVIIHPNFWFGKLGGHDLALVILSHPFIFTDTVFQVEIGDKEWWQNKSNAIVCQPSGFGSLLDPQNTRLRMWDTEASHGQGACPCTKRFQWKRLVCTRPSDTLPPLCGGDAGGAMICGDKAVAMAHMTRKRKTCANLMYPDCSGHEVNNLNTYIFLCPYNDWIRRYVPNVPPTPPSCEAPPHALPSPAGLVLVFASVPVILTSNMNHFH